jgi:hypothetical protein
MAPIVPGLTEVSAAAEQVLERAKAQLAKGHEAVQRELKRIGDLLREVDTVMDARNGAFS